MGSREGRALVVMLELLLRKVLSGMYGWAHEGDSSYRKRVMMTGAKGWCLCKEDAIMDGSQGSQWTVRHTSMQQC